MDLDPEYLDCVFMPVNGADWELEFLYFFSQHNLSLMDSVLELEE